MNFELLHPYLSYLKWFLGGEFGGAAAVKGHIAFGIEATFALAYDFERRTYHRLTCERANQRLVPSAGGGIATRAIVEVVAVACEILGGVVHRREA